MDPDLAARTKTRLEAMKKIGPRKGVIQITPPRETDQSTNLKDGTASFSAPEGELLLQFSINDAPYRLEKEPMYQMSVLHSCKSSNLTVDLGPGGDAHAHWE